MRLFRVLCVSALLVFAWASNGFAHDPNTATLDFQRVPGGEYILHIRTPLLHLDSAVRSGSEAGGSLKYGSKEYKLALANYIKNNMSLTANYQDAQGDVFAKPVKIKDMALKLGSHETSIILQLGGLDSNVSSLFLTAPLMSQNLSQENIFRYIDGATIEKTYLDKTNHFSGQISLSLE